LTWVAENETKVEELKNCLANINLKLDAF
jgi:hypothetical protein